MINNRFSWSLFEFCKQHQLIKPHDKILISISGGADSVCLAALLHQFSKQIPLSLHLAHLNHGFRKASIHEQQFVEQLAQQLGLPISVIQAPPDLKKKPSRQNSARVWRYQELEILNKKLNFNQVALGHQLNDLVETQLWKMSRGCSIFNLHPIALRHDKWIRPLLYTSRPQILNYLKQQKLAWVEDPSNQDLQYTRSQIRHQIMPLLEQCSGGNFLVKMQQLALDALDLDQLYQQNTHLKPEQLSYKELQELPKLLAQEHIHRFLLFNGVKTLKRYHIETIYKKITNQQGGWQLNLPGNKIACGQKKWLTVIEKPLPTTKK